MGSVEVGRLHAMTVMVRLEKLRELDQQETSVEFIKLRQGPSKKTASLRSIRPFFRKNLFLLVFRG